MATNFYGLPFIQAAQAQKHITHNAALDLVDGLLPGVAISATTGGDGIIQKNIGDVYIVPPAANFGDVTGPAVAVWDGFNWQEVAPPFGTRLFVVDEHRDYIFAGSAGWRPGSTTGALGGTLATRAVDFRVDFTGSDIRKSVAAGIPERVILLGVTAWIIQNITGPDQIKIGTASSADQFGGYIWHEIGASNIGVISPTATYSAQDITITAQDDTTPITSGAVGISVLFIEPAAAPIGGAI